MLNYQALYYLLEVSSAQSFTLAAEKLHMTRPALSTAIKNLEKDLDMVLLNRSHDGVSLTPYGEIVVQLAQKGFAFFDEIEHLTVMQPDIPSQISVYATAALNPVCIPALIKRYYEQYPDGKFNAYAFTDATPDEILSTHPDSFVMGIFKENQLFGDHVKTVVLDKSKTYLAMSPDAMFFPPEVKSISMKEVLSVPLIETATTEEQSFKNDLFACLRKYGEPNIRFTVSAMDMATPLIVDGLGATFYPSFKYLKTTSNSNYRTIRIKNAPTFILAVLYHKDLPQDELEFFLNLLNQV